ncbi:MAG TPA: hypothetical protein VFD12_00065, partial [Oligella sp.]|nr:hypothetical protein [Oligella sp.]
MAEITYTHKQDSPESRMVQMDTMPTQEPVAKLDSEEMVELHKELMDKYRRELERQYENRMEQAIDEDYYDSIQWSEEDAQVLRERGQAPMVYN